MVGFFEDAVGFLLYSGLFVVVTKGGALGWLGKRKSGIHHGLHFCLSSSIR